MSKEITRKEEVSNIHSMEQSLSVWVDQLSEFPLSLRSPKTSYTEVQKTMTMDTLWTVFANAAYRER